MSRIVTSLAVVCLAFAACAQDDATEEFPFGVEPPGSHMLFRRQLPVFTLSFLGTEAVALPAEGNIFTRNIKPHSRAAEIHYVHKYDISPAQAVGTLLFAITKQVVYPTGVENPDD